MISIYDALAGQLQLTEQCVGCLHTTTKNVKATPQSRFGQAHWDIIIWILWIYLDFEQCLLKYLYKFYKFLFGQLPIDAALNAVWKSNMLPKLKVFSWLLIHDRLNTRDLILRKHWQLNSGPEYVLCTSKQLVTREHFFFEWGHWYPLGYFQANFGTNFIGKAKLYGPMLYGGGSFVQHGMFGKFKIIWSSKINQHHLEHHLDVGESVSKVISCFINLEWKQLGFNLSLTGCSIYLYSLMLFYWYLCPP
jgi:hypothetical protein